jgi:glycosyltransferase involved in cell wall biosynthesis
VNTQTPLVRFRLGYLSLLEKYGKLKSPFDLRDLVEGEDYDYTPGGVGGMVYSAVQSLRREKVVGRVKWVSLGPEAPPRFNVGKIEFYNVSLDKEDVPLYTSFKEAIWNEIHQIEQYRMNATEYEAYVKYGWLSTELMMSFLDEVDLFFIHDFQQLQIGQMIGPSAPTVFRWHIPFDLTGVSANLRKLIIRGAEAFDAIIVSTKRDLEGLIKAGYRGRAYQSYPYTDPQRWVRPSRSETQDVLNRFSLTGNDRIIVVVGRMDPMKAQDVAISAVAKVKKQFPTVKLILVGNGSFTGSAKGGLAHPKVTKWRAELAALSRKVGVEDSVIFTGYISDAILKCLYSASDCVLIPSRIEGFNLTTIEAWLYRKPVVVSLGAGSSELVINKVNGYTFAPADVDDLAEKLRRVLANAEDAAKMGANGFDSARICFADRAVTEMRDIFNETLKQYSG